MSRGCESTDFEKSWLVASKVLNEFPNLEFWNN
jgi:hypothetical protein